MRRSALSSGGGDGRRVRPIRFRAAPSLSVQEWERLRVNGELDAVVPEVAVRIQAEGEDAVVQEVSAEGLQLSGCESVSVGLGRSVVCPASGQRISAEVRREGIVKRLLGQIGAGVCAGQGVCPVKVVADVRDRRAIYVINIADRPHAARTGLCRPGGRARVIEQVNEETIGSVVPILHALKGERGGSERLPA